MAGVATWASVPTPDGGDSVQEADLEEEGARPADGREEVRSGAPTELLGRLERAGMEKMEYIILSLVHTGGRTWSWIR